MNRDRDGPGTTCLSDCREMAAQLKTHACVCVCVCVCVCGAPACTHTKVHTGACTHRWQRNLAEALICRLDAGLSFLLAATPCYRSFSTTLRADNIYLKGAAD